MTARRWLCWLVLAAVLSWLAACGEPSDRDEVATTTGAAGVGLDHPVVIATVDGAFQIGTDGEVTLLFAGAAAVAVDDTQGGLLYQLESGRRGDGDERSTIVWWIPQGASTSQDLLVPAPSSGHRLTLDDAYSTADGFAVLYTRHETTGPPNDLIDSLRRFDVPARTVTEVLAEGAFEQGFGEATVGGELISRRGSTRSAPVAPFTIWPVARPISSPWAPAIRDWSSR